MYFDPQQYQLDKLHREKLLRQGEHFRMTARPANGPLARLYAPALAQLGGMLAEAGHNLQRRYGNLAEPARTSYTHIRAH